MSTEAHPNGLTLEGCVRVLFANDQPALDAYAAIGDRVAKEISTKLRRGRRIVKGDWAPHLADLQAMRADIRRDLLDATRRRTK